MRFVLFTSQELAKEGMIQKFILSGKAQPLGARWEEGFRDGYEATLKSKNPSVTPNNGPFGDDWNIQGDQYGNGYAEGWISGRGKIHDNFYN